jgi:hypothetical protein
LISNPPSTPCILQGFPDQADEWKDPSPEIFFGNENVFFQPNVETYHGFRLSLPRIPPSPRADIACLTSTTFSNKKDYAALRLDPETASEPNGINSVFVDHSIDSDQFFSFFKRL